MWPEKEKNTSISNFANVKRKKKSQARPAALKTIPAGVLLWNMRPSLLNCIIGQIALPIEIAADDLPDITFPTQTSFEL